MDTIGRKTPVPLTFTGWQTTAPATAAREVHARVAALPEALRRAAVAWLRPESEIAAELTASAGSGTAQPLRGVPYFLKDLFDVAGVPTGAGSTFLPSVRPSAGDSAVVRRLRELGAGLAGKTQLVEFASGLTGENPHFGDCPHPRFPQRLTGGSSSGSAALVAADVVPLAIGTDTGGSIRVPAAFCGLHGFRLTPGEPLIADAFPLSPTMDTAGWFTKSAADMLTAWRAFVAPSRGSSRPFSKPAPRGCHLPMAALLPSAANETARACDDAAARICPRADRSVETPLLHAWREAVDAYVTIGMSEAHAIHRNWLAPYREHYDPLIWKRFTDAGQFPPEKIAAARRTLAEVRTAWDRYFQSHDFLVLPSVPTPAPTKAECTPELRRAILALTAPASLGGLPCLAVPVELANGLTAGLQIIAREATSAVFEWALER